MRTIADIAELCLAYVDINAGTASLVESSTTVQKNFLCSTLTGALQELHAKKPEAFRVRDGATLPAPADISATVTNDSQSITLPGSGRDFRGLSVRSGSITNQIKPDTASPGSELLYPWTGSTGATTLRVYGDAILLGSSAFSVMGDVQLEGYGALRPCPDRATYTAYLNNLWRDNYGSRTPTLSRPRWTGLPEVWWAEPAYQAGTRQQLYLRFAPLPDQAYSVSYDLAFTPRQITVEDLSDTDVVLPIPGDFIDSILVPYVLQRWTGSPWFRNSEAKAEIVRQYETAKAMLLDWSAQEQQHREIVVVGD